MHLPKSPTPVSRWLPWAAVGCLAALCGVLLSDASFLFGKNQPNSNQNQSQQTGEDRNTEKKPDEQPTQRKADETKTAEKKPDEVAKARPKAQEPAEKL